MIRFIFMPVSLVHFLRFISIILVGCFTASGVSGQSYLVEIHEKWTNSEKYLEEISNIMPDSLYDFKPTEQQMTFKAQLIHIANNMINLSYNQLEFTTEPKPQLSSPDPNPIEIRQYLKSAFAFAGHAIENEKKISLDTVTKFFAGPKTHRQIINLMNDHVTHHRGQLVLYLRLCGLAPPRYIGW